MTVFKLLSAPRGARILIVEDDASQARLLRYWLNADGYEVVVASTGSEGIAQVMKGGWDAVLSDVDLPGASGLSILSESKRRAPSVPAVLMTAHSGIAIASAAIDRGVDGFLLKPLNKRRLIERLEHLIGQYRTRSPERQTVLAVGAHPDDVELGCGGTLLGHANAGDRVVVLTLSWGTLPTSPFHRRQEAEESTDRLGAELIGADLEDGEFEPREVTRLIEQVVDNFKPSTVYTHSAHDVHHDHRVCHASSMVACRSVPRLYCYQSPSSTIEFQPKKFVGIDREIDEKIGLIASFSSQTDRKYMDREMVRSIARYWSRYGADAQHVEPLEVVRDAMTATAPPVQVPSKKYGA